MWGVCWSGRVFVEGVELGMEVDVWDIFGCKGVGEVRGWGCVVYRGYCLC